MLKGSFGGYMLKGSLVFLGTSKLLPITHVKEVFFFGGGGGIYVLKGPWVFVSVY